MKTGSWFTHRCSSVLPRDTPIDFGKHKGKLLGTLPPTYLRWVSQNLRAGDSLRWAHLADRVLRDPVYRDRSEWELARNLLAGDRPVASSGSSALAELTEQFQWDNDDAEGWRRVDFDMLGTSRSGRIPRRGEKEKEKEREREKEERERGGGKRAERRERARVKRSTREFEGGETEENVKKEDRKGSNKAANSSPVFPGRRGLLKNLRDRFS